MSTPLETRQRNVDEDYHNVYRKNGDLREPYRIDNRFLVGTQPVPLPKSPETPTIVFINSRSGGRAGPDLAIALRHALGYAQVFDLDGVNRPDKVLEVLRRNLDAETSELSAHTRARMRIIAAGGDGTVAWILQAIKQLQLQPPPPIAVIPLGTGNDLARQFGWGGAFESRWIKNHKAIYETLERVANAKPEDLDTWQVKITAPDDSYFKGTMPYAFKHDDTDVTPYSRSAYSWNYLSIGMDAKAAYGFHHLRTTKPKLAFSRLANQFWYSYFACSSGWFCCTKDLQKQVPELLVQDAQGQWSEVPVSPSVKAMVVLNLQSYGAGRDLWGSRKDEKFLPPKQDDCMLEVIGLGNGWHTGMVMAGASAGKRLAQGYGVRIKLHGWRGTDSAFSKVHMQLDGEPWKQAIPNKADLQHYLEIEVTYANTAKVLHNYPGKPVPKPTDAPGNVEKYLYQPVAAAVKPPAHQPVASAAASAGTGTVTPATHESGSDLPDVQPVPADGPMPVAHAPSVYTSDAHSVEIPNRLPVYEAGPSDAHDPRAT